MPSQNGDGNVERVAKRRKVVPDLVSLYHFWHIQATKFGLRISLAIPNRFSGNDPGDPVGLDLKTLKESPQGRAI